MSGSEDTAQDPLDARFFRQHSDAINAKPAGEREQAFRTALKSILAASGIVDDQAGVDRQAERWACPASGTFSPRAQRSGRAVEVPVLVQVAGERVTGNWPTGSQDGGPEESRQT